MKVFFDKINLYGVPVLIAGLPLYLVRFSFFGIPFTLLELLFWIVFSFWFIENFKKIKESLKLQATKRKTKTTYYPFTFFIILFLLSSFIALFVADFSWSALGIYKAYFIEAILFYILVFNYFKIPKNRSLVFNSLFLSAFIISVYAIFQKMTGDYWSGGVNELRVTSVFPYPNALGLYLGPITVFLYFYLINIIQRFKDLKIQRFRLIFIFLTFNFSFLAIYFARSEAALIAVVVSVFLGSLFISKKFAIIFIILGIIGSGVVLLNNNLKSFALEKIQLKDFSGEVRKQQWRETVSVLENPKNFVFGCGLSAYQSCVESYHQEGIFFNSERDLDFQRKIVIFDDKYRAEHWRPTEIYMYPHNILLNFWTELGLLGVIAFLGLVIQFFYFGIKMLNDKEINKKNRIIIIGLMAIMLEIFIHGLVDVPYFKNDLSFLFWTFFAMMGVYYIEYSINKSSS